MMNKTFTFDSEKYTYETGEHNNARLNERAVEVPIAAKLASTYYKVLEVGNVLSHYGHEVHTVVDMGDYGKEIHTTDILLFQPGELFDCAISISTLEHMESVDHAIKAVTYIKSLLKPGSPYLFTIPYGFNTPIDDALHAGEFTVDEIYQLNKVDSIKHTWKQEPFLTVFTVGGKPSPVFRYNDRSQWANTIFILSGHTPDDNNDELSERARRKLDAIRRPDGTLDTNQLTFVGNDRSIDEWEDEITP